MTPELMMLTYVTGLTAVLWVPHIVMTVLSSGPGTALTYKDPGELAELPAWAQRAKRAHVNALENLAPFAALVLVAHAIGLSNESTILACTIFFWSRVAHAIVYWLGLPFVRTVAFAIGWFMMAWLFWEIINMAPAA